MFDFTDKTAEELEARSLELAERAAAIETELRTEGADAEALAAEADSNIAERRAIGSELETRRAAAAAAAEQRKADFEAGTNKFEKKTEERKMFGIETVEYRDAWVKKIIGRTMGEEERAALASAGAVIPTMTVNAVWDRLIKPAELLGKVDVTKFPSYVRFPKATTVNAATAHAVGATITESSDVIGYVDLVPNEYVKLLTVGADIENMAIPDVHDWIVENLTKSIRYAINKDILVGSGSNCLKGITASVNASATALTAAGVTDADLLNIMGSLGANYQDGAVWIMTPSMFYKEVMAISTFNNYIMNEGFQKKLFGHDVILMSEALVSSKETIFYGDPAAYKVNIFKALDVKPFETATTTNLQWRGACLADGELLDTNAFVRFART